MNKSAYVIEINTSCSHWFPEEEFVYFGKGKNYSSRNRAFLVAQKRIGELRVLNSDNDYRLILLEHKEVVVEI